MPIVHSIILGLLQGLTEFLPISSSGHLTLAPVIFGWDDGLTDAQYKTFEVALHAGTLIAAVAYLWKDLIRIISAFFSGLRTRSFNSDAKFGFMLLVSAIPGAALGALFEDTISEKFGGTVLTVSMIIVFGLVLFACDRIRGTRTAQDFTYSDAFLAGTAQSVALIPGVSRSGATMSFLRARGYSRSESARMSFLMLVPIVAGATVYTAMSTLSDGGIPSQLVAPMLVGFVVSAISGWLAVFGLIKLLQTKTFTGFVIYRILLGIGILIWFYS